MSDPRAQAPGRHWRAPSLLAALLFLTGCNTALDPNSVARLLEPAPIPVRAEGPPDADPGTCWGREQIPAVIETETHQVLVQPSQINSAGSLLEPPIYRTETRQRIVRERVEKWFETICPEAMSEDFTATLQRALAARDLYRGPATGVFDARTRQAVRRYQRDQGLDSALLSVTAARQLGLIAVSNDPS